MGVAATAVGVLAAPVVAGAALGAVGFTSAGVAVGSIAAGIQSAVYGGSVAAGSLFALCQSAGATGVIGSAPLLPQLPLVVVLDWPGLLQL